MRPGGLVLCHDTELTSAQMGAYLGRAVPGPVLPVAEALGTWCALAGLSWENTPGSSGLGTITIPGGSQPCRM